MAHFNLFTEVDNTVADLQAAGYQSYGYHVKSLANLLTHPDLASVNAALIESVDLEAFLEESYKSQGSFAGSGKLAWPGRKEEKLGLVLQLIARFGEDPQFMAAFGHTYFYAGAEIMAGVHNVTREIIVPFVRDYKMYVANSGGTDTRLTMPPSTKVFIVHGHDEGARESVARFLESLGLKPIILHEQASRGQTVIEKVEVNGDVGFAIVLLTPDDEGRTKGGQLQARVRQNVLLELGYFIGRLGRDRVCALKRGQVEGPSDFAGVVWQSMDDGSGWKAQLGRELEAAGYSIDWNRVMRP